MEKYKIENGIKYELGEHGMYYPMFEVKELQVGKYGKMAMEHMKTVNKARYNMLGMLQKLPEIFNGLDDKVYNIEMQVSNKKDLDKRVRYYQDLIDINILEKGADYKDLKESYVVFICLFDPFGRGGSRYTFRNRCDEYPDLVLKDDTYKIFFNTKNTQNEKNIDVKSFLQYVNGEKVNNKFIK